MDALEEAIEMIEEMRPARTLVFRGPTTIDIRNAKGEITSSVIWPHGATMEVVKREIDKLRKEYK